MCQYHLAYILQVMKTDDDIFVNVPLLHQILFDEFNNSNKILGNYFLSHTLDSYCSGVSIDLIWVFFREYISNQTEFLPPPSIFPHFECSNFSFAYSNAVFYSLAYRFCVV